MKACFVTLTTLFSIILLTYTGWGQSFLGLDGGIEGAAIIDDPNIYTIAQVDKWTKSDTTIRLINDTSVVRSGTNSLKISMVSTTMKRVYTPKYSIPSSTSKWYVQYYRRSSDTVNTQTQRPGNLRDSIEHASSTYSSVSAKNAWEKVTYAPLSILPATTVAGVILTKALGTGGDVYIDDFCIYAANTVDNTAPSSPMSPSASQTANIGELLVSWIDASGGIDDGGYMVLRKIGSLPDMTPLANGIYAVGNTISVGENIVYIGTSPSFTDNGLHPDSVYYYTIYTFDKAYNYSSGVSTVGDFPLPIQLTSLSASVVFRDVVLKWKTATETNCYGFDVERKEMSPQPSVISHWSRIGFVAGAGNSNSELTYSYIDDNVNWGHYVYRLKQIDLDGKYRYYGNAEVDIGTVSNELTLGNYPNPFNPTTTMVFSVPADGYLTLKVFNVLGQEIGPLFREFVQAGRLKTVLFDGTRFASGVYYSILEYKGQRLVKRMSMIK